MYDLDELKSGIAPQGAPWGSPFTREDPSDWECKELYLSVVDPNPTTTMAVAWDGINTIDTQEGEDSNGEEKADA